MSHRRSILAAASLLLLGNLASRLLGLVREQVITALFGITVVNTAFGNASTVSQTFYDLLVGGAISAALVPVLSDYSGPDDRNGLGAVVSTLLAGASLILVLLVLVLLAAAAPLTSILGATADARNYSLTLDFVRVTIPALFFLGLSGVVSAVCYARRLFTFPAFSIALYNLGLIVTVLLFHQRLGPNSLVLGLLAGAVLQLIAVVPGLRGIPLTLTFDPRHPAVGRMLRLYAPVAAGLVVTELAVLIDRHLANGLGPSSVAIQREATFLVQLPLGLVASATSLAVLPILSRLADDLPKFRQTLATGLRLALLAIAPATVFLVVFASPVIRLLLERGAFSPSDTDITARAFLLYAPQLPFVAVDQLLVYAFYARKNTLTPMLVGLGGVFIYLISALTMIGPLRFGLSGLILANTLQNSLHAVVLLVILQRTAGSLQGSGLGATLSRVVVAAVVSTGAALGVQSILPAPAATALLLAYLVGNAVVIAVAYAGVLHLLGEEEVVALPKLLRARFGAREPDHLIA